MKLKLTSDDRRAIDLFLDQAASAAGAPAQGYAAAAGTDHVEAVRRVFDLLAVLPQTEPTADLAARTLARIAGADGQFAQFTAGQIAADGQPHRPA